MTKSGICHLCGLMGKLSKEHVPPKRAFNQHKAIIHGGSQLFGTKRLPWDFTGLKGTQHQGGIGWYTLCAKCNNDTGAFYAKDYIEFTYQALQQEHLFADAPNNTWVTLTFHDIHPARVLKQIVTMFFSINSPDFAKVQHCLRSLVLKKHARGIDPKKYGIYLYALVRGELGKYIGLAAAGKTGVNSSVRLISELSIPPISYILEIDPKLGADANYANILSWSRFDYNDCVREIKIGVPVLESNTGFPMDHRTKLEVMLTGVKNRAYAYDQKYKGIPYR